MGILVTNSSIRTFQRCQLQYLYKYEDELVPRHSELPLKRGSWMHELLEAHYTGKDWRVRHKQLSREFNKMFVEERERYGNLPDECERLMKGYRLRWDREDSEMRIIAAEQKFEVKLPHGHTLQGKVDLLTEDEWGVWVWEHKTHKSFPDPDYRFLDVQTARYWYGIQKSMGLKITGVLWNYIRTRPPTVPVLTKMGKVARSANIDTEYYTFVSTLKKLGVPLDDYRDKIERLRRSDAYYRRERSHREKATVKQLVREAVVTADAIERGPLPIRSIERSCSWMCSYKDLCISDLYGGNTQSIVKAKFQHEDPFARYEEEVREE